MRSVLLTAHRNGCVGMTANMSRLMGERVLKHGI